MNGNYAHILVHEGINQNLYMYAKLLLKVNFQFITWQKQRSLVQLVHLTFC